MQFLPDVSTNPAKFHLPSFVFSVMVDLERVGAHLVARNDDIDRTGPAALCPAPGYFNNPF